MDITGKIYLIKDEEVISANFKKREFVLEISNNPAFVEKVLFTLTQDRTSLIDGYSKGDDIKVFINLKGKEWTSPKNEVKYFNTIDVWKIEAPQNSEETNANSDANVAERVDDSDEDDLPF